jgi:hypothetical protein
MGRVQERERERGERDREKEKRERDEQVLLAPKLASCQKFFQSTCQTSKVSTLKTGFPLITKGCSNKLLFFFITEELKSKPSAHER